MFQYNLKVLMFYRGISNNDLAEELGVTKQAISSWVTGRTLPQNYLRKKIAFYFGISVETLMNEKAIESDKLGDIQSLRNILVSNGVIPPDREMTKEDFENALKFFKVNAPLIFEEK